MAEPLRGGGPRERRRLERRHNSRLSDITLPELRRMLITTGLFVIVLVLFLWMVRTVIIGTILGVVVAVYLRPVYLRLLSAVRSGPVAAALTLILLLAPVVALAIYSYTELAWVTGYVDDNREEITARIDGALNQLPFIGDANTTESVRRWVIVVSNYGTEIPGAVRDALGGVAVSATIFVFTVFYGLIDAERIAAYVRSKIPPRYDSLIRSLAVNVRGVLYGAIYSSVVTQTAKSLIVFALCLVFGVPLAGVLAILSFLIGFFPIVGSWTVYVPVAAWLAVFRDAPAQAVAMLAIGFFVNTLYISTYLRPKIAAERSKVLNFYWMLVGLVTGVYTFGLVGILLGPILIGLLKAIVDTITAAPAWRLTDADGDGGGDSASGPMS
jgi:predicted PurR-regulated permease PerM